MNDDLKARQQQAQAELRAIAARKIDELRKVEAEQAAKIEHARTFLKGDDMTRKSTDTARYQRALDAAKSGDYATARRLLKGFDHPKARALLAKVNEKSTPARSWKRVALFVVIMIVFLGFVAFGLLVWAGSLIEIEDPFRERLVDACVVEGQLTRSACERWADDGLDTYRLERCVLDGDELWFDVLNCAENMGAVLP